MADNIRRKCFKCGRSPRENPDIKLFRFPNPGRSNTQRCELWAKFCFPDKEWYSHDFQKKLYAEHRMLCNKHFEESAFTDFVEKKLNRSAVPDVSCDEQASSTGRDMLASSTSLPTILMPQDLPPHILMNITNIDKRHNKRPSERLQPSMEPMPDPSIQNHEVIEVQPGPSHVPMDVTDILPCVEAPIQHFDVLGLSKKEHRLKLRCRRQMKEYCRLKNRIKKHKPKAVLKALERDENINKLINSKIPSAFALLLQGQIKNFKRKARGRRWTMKEKIIALRMYKRSPTCYRLLRRLFCLPAPTSLKVLLGKLEMTTGINKKIFDILTNFANTLKPSENEFILMWDEMSIRKNLNYNKKLDIIEGYQDHAQQGRTAEVASHALVFMIAGIRKKVKQPIAFYISGGSVTADRLAFIIKDVLRACFESEIHVTATVCDQDGVNRRALKLLGATVEDPTIRVLNKVVVTLLDTPHFLKFFQNLLLKYDIECPTNISSDDISNTGVARHPRLF